MITHPQVSRAHLGTESETPMQTDTPVTPSALADVQAQGEGLAQGQTQIRTAKSKSKPASKAHGISEAKGASGLKSGSAPAHAITESDAEADSNTAMATPTTEMKTQSPGQWQDEAVKQVYRHLRLNFGHVSPAIRNMVLQECIADVNPSRGVEGLTGCVESKLEGS